MRVFLQIVYTICYFKVVRILHEKVRDRNKWVICSEFLKFFERRESRFFRLEIIRTMATVDNWANALPCLDVSNFKVLVAVISFKSLRTSSKEQMCRTNTRNLNNSLTETSFFRVVLDSFIIFHMTAVGRRESFKWQ